MGKRQEYSTPVKVAMTIGVVASLWFFLFGLSVMGTSFKILGGRSAGNLFSGIENPLAGLMVGILATVLVQSSSTSTSIVVGLVGSGIMSVKIAIPIIMGANIGTSVTNTIVSMGHIHNKDEYQRAFSGATVHDMFNFLTVLVLLPLEVIIGGLTGEGGILFYLSEALTSGLHGTDAGTFTSPIKIIVSPVVKTLIAANKDVIKAISLGQPTELQCLGKTSIYKESTKLSYKICKDWAPNDAAALAATDANWTKYITEGKLVKGGVFEDSSDELAGTVCLVISLVVLCAALFMIVFLLKKLVLGTKGASADNGIFSKILGMNGYLAIFVGMLLTICVQSSSIITSAMTPLVGLGSLGLENMLAFSLGANIGTTCTGLLAAMVAGTVPALQIALCHLLFNIVGILIWYPIPLMRQVPLSAARGMGYLTICFNWWPMAYIGVAFVFCPLVLLAVSSLIDVGGVGGAFGWVLFVAICLNALAFVGWYKLKGGKAVLAEKLAHRYEAGCKAIAEKNAAEGLGGAGDLEMGKGGKDKETEALRAEEAAAATNIVA